MIIGFLPILCLGGSSRIEPYPITYWGINTFLSNSVYFYQPTYYYNNIEMQSNNINNVNNMTIINSFSLRSLTGYTNLYDQIEKAEGPSNLVEVIGQRKIRITFSTITPGSGTLVAGVVTNSAVTNIVYLADIYTNALFSLPPCVVMSWAPTQTVDVLAQPEVIEVYTNRFSWRIRSSSGINTNPWLATFIAVDSTLLHGGGIGNAQTVAGYAPGNGVNNIPINNNVLNIGLDSDKLDGKHDWEYTINKVNEYSTDHVIDSTDYGKNIVLNNTAPITNVFTLPAGDSSLVGLTMSFNRVGTGALKITAQSGIILDSTNITSSLITEPWASITLTLVHTNLWIIKGINGTWVTGN